MDLGETKGQRRLFWEKKHILKQLVNILFIDQKPTHINHAYHQQENP
jgi:hypothetical protein